MCARNEREVVLPVEVADDVGAEEEARAARGQAPAFDLVRVGPEEVAHGAFMGDFLLAVDEADLVDGVDEGGEAAVDAEDGAGGGRGVGGELGGGHLRVGGGGLVGRGSALQRGRRLSGGGGRVVVRGGAETGGVGGFGEGEVVELAAEGFVHYFAVGVEDFAFDVFVVSGEGRLGRIVEISRHRGGEVGGCAEHERAQGEVVEDLAAVAPDVRAAVLADALVVEAIHGCYLPRLVVTSYECDAVWVADLEAEEEEEGFKRVEAAVDEVAHEEVVCLWYIATDSEQLHQVVKLAVYISAYCDRRINCDDIAFFDQQLSRLIAEFSDL